MLEPNRLTDVVGKIGVFVDEVFGVLCPGDETAIFEFGERERRGDRDAENLDVAVAALYHFK